MVVDRSRPLNARERRLWEKARLRSASAPLTRYDPTMLEDSARQIENSKGQRPDGERLHALFALHWTYTLDEYPELATYTGDPGRNHQRQPGGKRC